jgi:hypothetical protein
MSNSNSSKQILLSVIGVAILVVAVVGVSFAFFNYTRTGAANTIRTGTISFNTSNSVINITNLFPIAKGDVATDVNNVGTGTVTITGSTNYTNGIDFTVTAEEVSSNIGTTSGKLPLSIAVSQTGLNNVTAFGSNSGAISLTPYEDGATITSGSELAKGRIPANTNVNGTITIKAYIDEAGVAITDTYNGPSSTPNDNNGTTSTWVDGRTVLTTAQWNALASTPASFKIRVVANEGAA